MLDGFLDEFIFVRDGEERGVRLLLHKLSDANRLHAVAGIGALGQQIDFEIFGIPVFRDDGEGPIIAERSGRVGLGDTHAANGQTFDGIGADVFPGGFRLGGSIEGHRRCVWRRLACGPLPGGFGERENVYPGSRGRIVKLNTDQPGFRSQRWIDPVARLVTRSSLGIAGVEVVGLVGEEGAVLKLIDEFKLNFGGEGQSGHGGNVLAVHPLGNAPVTRSGDGRGYGGLRKARRCREERKEEKYGAEWNAHGESSSHKVLSGEYSIRQAVAATGQSYGERVKVRGLWSES